MLHFLPGYIASEYFDDIPNGGYKDSVLCLDLMNIPLADESLDLVISEDVIEHIVDYRKAFAEINRVLVSGGYHIFTVPLHEGKKTVSRLKNPHKVFHGDPIREAGSYVITDFGSDLPEILKKYGMQTSVSYSHSFFGQDEITNADETYETYLSKRYHMDEYFKYNSVVFVSRKASPISKRFMGRWLHGISKEDDTGDPTPSKELIDRYYDGISVSGFSPETDKTAPSGCYSIEGDVGHRYTWVSKEVYIALKRHPEAKQVAVKGYVNMEPYRAKGIMKLKLWAVINDELEPRAQAEITENTDVDMIIPLDDCQTREIAQLRILASDAFCPYLEGTGNDQRRLSWILREIVQI